MMRSLVRDVMNPSADCLDFVRGADDGLARFAGAMAKEPVALLVEDGEGVHGGPAAIRTPNPVVASN